MGSLFWLYITASRKSTGAILAIANITTPALLLLQNCYVFLSSVKADYFEI